jgi:uncharacterized protein (TIGR03067 family)
VLAVLAALAALVGCSKKADDKARLQGEWTIAAIETPEMPNGEQRAMDQFKELSVTIEGDRATIRHPTVQARLTVFFTLSAAKTPKEVDTTNGELTHENEGRRERDADAQLDPARGIYKFEGDELVLALPVGRGRDLPRPTEFKPALVTEPAHAVIVFRLKKK